MQIVSLRNACLQADVLPSVGGALARFDAIDGAAPRAIFRPCPIPPVSPSQVACFAMLPWANRLSPEGFVFEGRAVKPAPNRQGEPCPIHGEGWQAAWDVMSHSASSVLLALDRSHGAPFSYQAQMHYELLDETLQVTLEVRNAGSQAMPFGVGLHPWFERHGGETINGKILPIDALDQQFSHWNGVADIWLPASGVRLTVVADMRHYILYSPAGASFFCFEPVDHVVNGHNAPGGAAANGLSILAPGQTLRRRLTFTAQTQ